MSLLDEIIALGVDLNSRNDGEIATALSNGRVKVIPCPIGIGTILGVMAPAGGAFLNGLEAMGAIDPNVRWALETIKLGTFDVGNAGTRLQLGEFASQHPEMQPAIAALLAVAEVSDIVTPQDVAKALEGY